jgi:hypothetical protein
MQEMHEKSQAKTIQSLATPLTNTFFICVGVMYSCEYDVCDVNLHSMHPDWAS